MRDHGLTTSNQNRAFNKKVSHGGSGSPKATDGGMDLSPKATNVIGGTKLQQTPVSPSANANSRNTGGK